MTFSGFFPYKLLKDILFLVLYSGSLLFTYFIYSSVYLLSKTSNLKKKKMTEMGSQNRKQTRLPKGKGGGGNLESTVKSKYYSENHKNVIKDKAYLPLI